MFSLILDTITIQKLLKYARKKCGERVFLEFIINNFKNMNIEQLRKMTDGWIIKNFYFFYWDRLGKKATIKIYLRDWNNYEVENDNLDIALNKISILIN